MKPVLILIYLSITFLVSIITFGILQYRSQKPVTLSETVPLLPSPTQRSLRSSDKNIPSETPAPVEKVFSSNQASEEISAAEKDKLLDFLPLRQSNFPTSTKIKTTIYIFSSYKDPLSVIRVEIRGIDYHQTDVSGPDALAFKDSFVEAKRELTTLGIDIRKLHLVFGSYQYIQDTATNWIKVFKLLD